MSTHSLLNIWNEKGETEMTESHLVSLHLCNLQNSTYFLLMKRQFESEMKSSG